MKQYLLKTLFVSVMMFGATSVWADASMSRGLTIDGVHGNTVTSKEIDEARVKLRLSIEEASEIQENGRNSFYLVTNAITVAQGVYDNNNATVEQLEGAIKTLTDAVKAFILANYSDLLRDAINLASGGSGLNSQSVVNVISNTNSILKEDLKKAIIEALAVKLPGIEDLVDAIVEYVKDGQQNPLKEAMEDFEAREKLRLSIEEVNEIKEADRNSFITITDALTVAQGVYNDVNATKESLEQAIKDLLEAVRSFMLANLPDATLQQAINLASDGDGLNAQRVLNVIINTPSTNWADLKQAIINALAKHTQGIEDLVSAIVEYVKNGEEDNLQAAIENFNNPSTGISTITVNAQDDMVYNMAGQRVMNVKKGLYIINGKKQLMK